MAASNTSGVFDPNQWFGQTLRVPGIDEPVMMKGLKKSTVISDTHDYYGETASGKKVSINQGVKGVSSSGAAPASQKRTAKVNPSRAPYDATSGVITPDVQAQDSVAKGAAEVTADRATAAVLEDQGAQYNRAQQMLAAGGFLIDVMNANNAYQNAVGEARINIMLARNSANDAISRGRQAALDRQLEGYQAGQDATLAMAAQGQDVTGAGVSKVQGSYEAMGYFNAAREEINSFREALGYELEIVSYEYQSEVAGYNRDVAIWGSALKTAVTMGAYA